VIYSRISHAVLAAVLGCAITASDVQAVAEAQELMVAAASDLNFAFKELVAEYEKKAGLATSGSLYRYAVGRIVLWVPARSPLAVEKLGMEILLDPSIKRIAIANPKHAPYGRAAVTAMQHFKVYDRVKDKLVLGENISQTAQFIESGASDIGIIALSLALAPVMKDAGKYWEVPADAHPPLEQGAAILKNSKRQVEAKAFLEFLKGDRGREIMRQYGFILPE
jgi:molybdate transport system substrate-binding protein